MLPPVLPVSLPIASVAFTSCFIHVPHAAGALARASQRLCTRVKQADTLWLAHYAGQVYALCLHDRQFAALFAHAPVLVPVPRSVPGASGPWAARELAQALVSLGLASRVWTGLVRHRPVKRSATAASGTRPSVLEHFESLAVSARALPVSRVVLVDDIVTKGRTLLAAAARLQTVPPPADVRAFALVRTQGFRAVVRDFLEPCHGVIRWAGGDARRDP